jgi:hypothetical protein
VTEESRPCAFFFGHNGGTGVEKKGCFVYIFALIYGSEAGRIGQSPPPEEEIPWKKT